jgi:hypothetical protein
MLLKSDIVERRQQLLEVLKHNTCVVSFTKVNGETRNMPCTLQETVVPKRVLMEDKIGAPARKVNTDVLSVWCTDKNEWRSFRLDSITSVEVLDK